MSNKPINKQLFMKKITMKIMSFAAVILLVAACTNTKNKEASDIHYQANGDAVYPAIEGMIPFAINVDEKGENEANQKVQMVVGKMMEVDCNNHSLEGNFKNETLEGYGYDYFVFETNGNVASTMMACPDDTKTQKFISSQDQFMPYNSKLTTPVYVPEGYEVHYTIWSVENEYNGEQIPNTDINTEAAQLLKSYPETMDNYDRYVIYLPKQENEEALRLEVIPGIMKEVDCNTHWLTGDFDTKEIEGMGYDYMVFESDGTVAATRMACPDNKLTEKFVAANGNFGRYNSQLPMVIFVPKGVEIKYNVWKANKNQVADKL